MTTVEMTRLSGNVNAKGEMIYNTSNNDKGWTSELIAPGKIKIGFGIGLSFTQPPNVLVNVINTEVEPPHGDVRTSIFTTKDSLVIELWQKTEATSNQVISFAAFGILVQ